MRNSSENKISLIQNLLLLSVALGIFITSVGCGNAKTAGGSQNGASNIDTEVPSMDELSSKLEAMDVEILNVDNEMTSLDLQNPLNLLGDNLKDSIKKFSSAITDVKAKIAELKLKINEHIAKLDANDPKQQKIILKLQESLAYLDEVTIKLDEVVAKIEAKVDALFAKLEKKIEEKLSGVQEVIAKLALGKLEDSILKHLIGG